MMHSCSTLQALQCLMMHATLSAKSSGCEQCQSVSEWQPCAMQCCLHRLHDLGRSCYMATALYRDGVSTNCITHRLVPWRVFNCITNGRSACFVPWRILVSSMPSTEIRHGTSGAHGCANNVPCLSCNAVTPIEVRTSAQPAQEQVQVTPATNPSQCDKKDSYRAIQCNGARIRSRSSLRGARTNAHKPMSSLVTGLHVSERTCSVCLQLSLASVCVQ
jgi:hypothetical protein